MTTKKPAITTQLKTAQARVAELEKALESEKRNSGYARDARTEAEGELNQLHAFFDALPGTISRQDEKSYQKNSAMTRLAAWLATK